MAFQLNNDEAQQKYYASLLYAVVGVLTICIILNFYIADVDALRSTIYEVKLPESVEMPENTSPSSSGGSGGSDPFAAVEPVEQSEPMEQLDFDETVTEVEDITDDVVLEENVDDFAIVEKVDKSLPEPRKSTQPAKTKKLSSRKVAKKVARKSGKKQVFRGAGGGYGDGKGGGKGTGIGSGEGSGVGIGRGGGGTGSGLGGWSKGPSRGKRNIKHLTSDRIVKSTIRVWVLPDGKIKKLEVAVSSGFPELDQMALENVRARVFDSLKDKTADIRMYDIEVEFSSIR